MNVLVTGIDGYIGSVLASVLLERGHDVVGLDTGFYREGLLYNSGRDYPKIVSADTRNITESDVAGFDAVVHLAELSNDPLGQLNPDLTYAINYGASSALAETCKHAGVSRFVYTSSCSVYGAGQDELRTEESPPNPQTAYAHCKVLVEHAVSELADDDFSPTFLRNATAYGPAPRMRFDIVLNNLAGLAWTTSEIKMRSDGTPWRPLVHVRDICEAIACTLEAPRDTVHNEVFNVGDTAENYRVRDIAKIVADAFPGCTMTLGENDEDNRSYRVSFEKISSQLPGFRCRHTAAIGAEQLYDLFSRIHLTPEQFQFRAFTRLKQLQHLRATQQIDDAFFWQHDSEKSKQYEGRMTTPA